MVSAGFGGPHNTASRIAMDLRKTGVELLVGLPGEPGDAAERLQRYGIRVLQFPIHRLRRSIDPRKHAAFVVKFRSDIQRLRSVIRSHGIDLIHVNGILNVHGAIAAKMEGVPVVWGVLERAPAAARRAAIPLIRWLADAVMITGSSLLPAYPGLSKLGSRLISFVPAIDLDKFDPDSGKGATARKELGLSERAMVVGNIGNINPDKDHLTFVRAAAAVKAEFPHTRFVILGSALEHRKADELELWKVAARLGLAKDRDLIIRPGGERVAELAQAFDIFWMTSRSEGLPAAVGEAMALRLPVVSTDVGSIRDVVKNGATGYLVPIADHAAFAGATRGLIENPDARKAIGEEGRRVALERFSPRACADAHMRAFRAAINHRRGENEIPA